ncbi:MAG: hypothetical protein HFJ26_00840 [Clostridia bacterium]|nr:hypothetical protein [Clostridia bacterium]
MNWLGIIISYLYIGIIIAGAKLFEKRGEEASRKFIHIMLGNWWFIAMYFFTNVWFAIFVPITFVIINYVSYKQDLIKVMERKNQDGLGTVYYAVSLFILAIVSFGIYQKPILGLIPNVIMAYGDGFAAVVGKCIKSKTYKVGETKKSIAGSITMFMISLIFITIFLTTRYTFELWQIVLIGIVMSGIVTIIEAISVKGIDNISVPVSMLVMLLMI